jgi:mycoredoxin
MQKQKNNIILYGTRTCGDCIRSKAWLDKHGIEYEEVNIDEDEKSIEYITKLNHGVRKIPTIVFSDGSFLIEPINKALEEHVKKLGIM